MLDRVMNASLTSTILLQFQPMKFNIIKESDSGKVSVEIFEMHKKKSLNQELVEMNLAKPHITDVDEKLSDEDEAG